jgi:AcrR family transcriptional regulator
MNARLRADERRDEVILAAIVEFAAGGLAGTSTATIARRAGVSQPYLFQLFGTKKELFLAAVRGCFERTRVRFEESGRAARTAGLDSKSTLEQMGHAYARLLLADPYVLRLQLHSYAACDDPEVRAVVRDEFLGLWRAVADVSGVEAAGLHEWFAEGMLINVIASIGKGHTLEEFDTTVPGGVLARS